MAKISINLSSGTLKKEELIIGIDLGTTNSLVALIPEKGAAPVALAGADKSSIVPSIVYFDGNNQPLVGNQAKPYLLSDPSRTIYSVKRLMGKSYKDVSGQEEYFSYKVIDNNSDELVKIRVGDQFYTPIELSSLILRELKQRAEKHLNAEVKKAVITVPAYFNDAQRQATRDAGKLAGLEVLRIVNEPTAASLAYGIGLEKGKQKLIAVYDLGGGTFDISILRIHDGIFEVLSTHGDTFLGGDDFDRAVMDHWLKSVADGKELLKDKSFTQKLRLKAELAKKRIAIEAGVSDSIELPSGGALILELDRKLFDSLISPIVKRSIDSCRKAVADAGIELEEIEEVVMVGGSTRTALVKEEVRRFFKHSRIDDSINPDEVVALGAAIEADILAGNRKDLVLLDVTPLSLGIETLGGLMDFIIPRNSKIPCRASRQYTTSVDGQVNILISVFQGERDLVAENRKLAEFDLKGIPAMPAGLPKVEITFTLNADGILLVAAKELRSGISQQIEVKPQYGLTDEQVETMLRDSLTHAQQDVETRLLVEARTEGEQLIYLTTRFMEKNPELMTEAEKEHSNLLIRELQDVLTSGNRQLIHEKIEKLNEYSTPFAQRIMDIAVQGALQGKKI